MDDTAIEMHLARTGPADVLQRREVVLGPPGPGEARVAIEATGVAYADVVMRQGLYPGVRAPVTPGYDLVGRIEALGPGVEGLAVGQRVAALTVTGSYASRRNVEARWLVPAPEGVDAGRLVAAVLNGLTAWQMFTRIAVAREGEWVLVHGAAGGVGALLLDIARRAGVRTIGTASAGKRAVVEARGGVHLDYRTVDVASRAREISGGGVVAAYDHIGGKHLKTVSQAALRMGGTAILYGGYDATRGGRLRPGAMIDLLLNAGVSTLKLFSQSQGVVGYNVSYWRDARPETYRADLALLMDLVGRGEMDPLIGADMPLAEAAAAHRALETTAVSGKIILRP
jgi:NADPH:quinone reductase-like Zn-dependent oxidoreductase